MENRNATEGSERRNAKSHVVSLKIIMGRRFFCDDINGAAFGFQICLGEILSQDAGAEELDAAEEEDDADEGGPALDGIAGEEVARDDESDGDEGKQATEKAANRREDERLGGEGDDAFDSVGEKFPEAPLRFTGNTRYVFKFDPFGAEANPAEKTLGETVVFANGEESVHKFAIHQPVVARAVDEIGIGDTVHEAVELPRKKGANRWLAFSCDAAGRCRIIAFLGDGFVHLRQKGGRILQVGVHEADVIAAGFAEAGQNRRFFSEVSGKGNIAHAGIFGGEFFHKGKCRVFGAVIDEKDFERFLFHVLRKRKKRVVKIRQRGFFVVARDDERNQWEPPGNEKYEGIGFWCQARESSEQ